MKPITLILLIFGIVPYLFIIGFLCGSAGVSHSEEGDYQMLPLKIIILRIIMTKTMGAAFVLPVAITYPAAPEGFTLLRDMPRVFNIPVFSSIEEKPPRILPAFH
ncbi:MAG: hypothetical protein HZC11_07660 [Nitrospirae bacterium]|nr:hypothetical protein [Nitrospirota bacterium]